MPTRCDIIVIAWTTFVGLDLVFNAGRALWGGEEQALPDLYRGQYRLAVNGTTVRSGKVQLTYAARKTSAFRLDLAVMQLSLMKESALNQEWSLLESTQPDDKAQDFAVSAISVDGQGSGSFSASGSSNPKRFTTFGARECRLMGLVSRHGSGEQGLPWEHPSKLGLAGRPAHNQAEPSESMAREWGVGAMALAGIDINEHGESLPSGWLSGEFVSSESECGFVFAFKVSPIQWTKLSHKLVRYTLWALLLTLIEVRCLHAQMQHTEESAPLSGVSSIGIAMQAMMDAYSSFCHFLIGLHSRGRMFNIIAVVALLKFVQFSLLEARYLLTIWRARRQDDASQDLEYVRMQIMWFYSTFYAVLVAVMLLVQHNLSYLPSVVMITQLYWVPQIVLNIWQGTRRTLTPVFYVGISVLRTLMVLYVFGCPEGIFTKDLYPLPGTPSTRVCLVVVILQFVQVCALRSQDLFGSRWFIPWICMPLAHNYNRQGGLEEGAECVICMSEIDAEDGRYAVTPCSHRFHVGCLRQWLDIKMECPTCRAALPPIL